MAALGDGAHRIWQGYARHIPNRVDILDFYHVSVHLTTVSEAWHGANTAEGKHWVSTILTASPP